MRRIICGIVSTILVIMLFTNVVADTHKTVFDEFAEGQTVLINSNPICNEDRSLDELLYSGSDYLLTIAAEMWYNCLEEELRQGKKLNNTMAAEIFRGFKQGNVLCSITALSRDAVNLHVVYGIYNKKACKTVVIYWMEWNTEEQELRVAKLITEDKDIRSDMDILYSDEYNYWTLLAKRDPALPGFDDSIGYMLDRKSGFVQAMNHVYSEANSGKKLSIK